MAEAHSDGIAIRYEDVGEGEPALLCLPGWCSSRAKYDDFAGRLAAHRRVLALDWRGHGRSDRAAGDFDEAALVRDALAVIAASGAQQVVPLATAHAGWVAIELRRALGAARVPRLVLVDWIVTAAPPPFLGGLAALQRPDQWQAVRDQLFAMWLEGVDDANVVRFVREDMGSYGFDMWARAGREIAAAYARAHSPLEALAQLSPPPPTLHVYAQPADPAYLQAQRQFAATHPWLEVERIDARSHFPTLEAPERVAARVERFLAG
ncbi:MAG TPA: alpha/beta hydrolase [Polyangia bacterium]